MGELGTLYDLAPVSLVAGSLLPHLKGHNPIEPAKLGSAILTGPYVESFQDLFRGAMIAAGGAVVVTDAATIARRRSRRAVARREPARQATRSRSYRRSHKAPTHSRARSTP